MSGGAGELNALGHPGDDPGGEQQPDQARRSEEDCDEGEGRGADGHGGFDRLDTSPTDAAAARWLRKAAEQELDLTGCVAASDGFFPFPDSIELMADNGVRAVIAPSGSIRDEEVAAAAGELGVTLVFSDRRHFNH